MPQLFYLKYSKNRLLINLSKNQCAIAHDEEEVGALRNFNSRQLRNCRL